MLVHKLLRILIQSVSKHCRRCTIRTAADASYLIAPCCWILAQFDRVVKLFHLQLSEQLVKTSDPYIFETNGGQHVGLQFGGVSM